VCDPGGLGDDLDRIAEHQLIISLSLPLRITRAFSGEPVC
jgi:hypothetical protein